MDYYQLSATQALARLSSSHQGLSQREAVARYSRYGPNVIREKPPVGSLIIFFRQFESVIVYILLAAVLISLLLHEYVDALVIGIILILNAILGFIQEYRTERSIQALKRFEAPQVLVYRNGKRKRISAHLLVPGDVIELLAGSRISGDARLIEVWDLAVQESALTGESHAVTKQLGKLAPCSIGDRTNMVFAGTHVVRGRGKAVIIQTGMRTEFGKIAKVIQETTVPLTPLQKQLKGFSKWLGLSVLGICAVVFVVGWLKGGVLLDMLLVGVSLAVAAIPEGLPAIVTISLALGVQRMIHRRSLVRTLPSVETLGSTTVIAADKTGTITKNEMTVIKLYLWDKVISVTGTGYTPAGKFTADGKNVSRDELGLLLRAGVLANNAELQSPPEGDPTEVALLISGAKAGIQQSSLQRTYPRMSEIPFSSERKRMSVVVRHHGKSYVYMKGALEVILSHCDRLYDKGMVRRLQSRDKEKILSIHDRFASEALRVLGFAYAQGSEEKKLVFIGMQGMLDPPREEVRDAIHTCHHAGIKVVMITGDHAVTAKAVAHSIGITGDVVVGSELSESAWQQTVDSVGVFARVDPKHKIAIVDAFQKYGHVVAMTGDGVNDAPALKKADIGIAMGIKGTDVAKEASNMVLVDDNFASIVEAVEEGRGIYDNIRKFVNYLLSSNFGEVLLLFFALIIGFQFGGRIVIPLAAIHLLWINLVTDGLPALALGVDPSSPDIMERKPRDPKQGLLTRSMQWNIVFIGVLMSVGCLVLFANALSAGIVKAQTMVFTALVVMEIMRIYMVRSQYHVRFFSNKYLFAAIFSSLLLQLLVIYSPLQSLFKTTMLALVDWLWILGTVFAVFVAGVLGSKLITYYTGEVH